MRPVKIAMQAFGSYLRRTEIDFSILGENPIFLITGATGGGKTTILDAMCFALYGKATGGRRSWTSMRCTAAPQELETLVELVFRLGEDTYRFARTQKLYPAQGTGEMKTKETHECWHGAADGWELLQSGSERRVRECAEQLLGLDCEQFSQVIVLPQGDFLRLLLSSSKEKGRIFQTLFATGKWERAALRLRDRAAALERKAGELEAERRALLSREEAETPEQVKQKQGELSTLLEQNRRGLEAAEALLAEKNVVCGAAKELCRLFAEWETADKRAADLTALADEKKRDRERLERTRKAQGFAPVLESLRTARLDLLDQERKLRDARENARMAEEAEQKAAAALPRAQACRKRAEELSREIGFLDGAVKRAGRCAELEKSLAEIRGGVRLWQGKEREAQEKLETAVQRLTAGDAFIREAQRAAAELPKLLEETQKLMRTNAAADLARELSEGEPCPVCGAIHHPIPARQSERLQAAQEAVERAKKSAGKLESAQSRMELRRRELEEAQALLGQCREELARQRGAEDGAASSLEELQKSLEHKGDFRQLAERLRMAGKEARDNAHTAEQLEKKNSEAKSTASAAHAARRAAEDAAARAGTAVQTAQERLLKEMEAAGLPPDADCGAWLLPQEEALRLEESLNAYRANLDGAKQRAEALRRELEGKVLPNLEAVEAERSAAQERVNLLAAEGGSLEQHLKSTDVSLRRLEDLEVRGSTLLEEYSRTKRLAALLSGKNAMKIPIHQFVLGIMLDDILTQANQFFSVLSGGRYSLNRVNRASGGNAYGGLDLQVFDAFGGGRRAVETLSGGELFLASLALAFGLSDVVQRYSGGVRLDSIFIDEGFGSLDQDALDTAMRALAQIRGMGRMVGVISHVSELKERIAAQIIVTRASDGGSAARLTEG